MVVALVDNLEHMLVDCWAVPSVVMMAVWKAMTLVVWRVVLMAERWVVGKVDLMVEL